MNKDGKALVVVQLTAEEKAEMAAIAKRKGLTLAAWAEQAIRAAWLRRSA